MDKLTNIKHNSTNLALGNQSKEIRHQRSNCHQDFK